MKKLLLFFLLTTAAIAAKSQSYNYNSFGIGVNASAVYPYADVAIAKNTYAFDVTAYYYPSPFLPIGLEFQTGTLSGGSITLDPHKRQYTNSYKAAIVHADLYMGQLIDYDYSFIKHLVKDLYIGAGIGAISNNMTSIVRVQPGTGYVFPGSDKSVNLMVPLRVGYEVRINNSYGEQFMAFNFGLVTNITWGEGLDGYADPSKNFKNNAPDMYRQIFAGLKFNFGPSKSYSKTIN